MSEKVIQFDAYSGMRVLPRLQTAESSLISIREDQTSYEICIALPGLDSNDFIVRVVGDELTISAKADAETQSSFGAFSIDRRAAVIEQTFALPPAVYSNNMTTTLNHGVLTVLLTRIPASSVVPLFPAKADLGRPELF